MKYLFMKVAGVIALALILLPANAQTPGDKFKEQGTKNKVPRL